MNDYLNSLISNLCIFIDNYGSVIVNYIAFIVVILLQISTLKISPLDKKKNLDRLKKVNFMIIIILNVVAFLQFIHPVESFVFDYFEYVISAHSLITIANTSFLLWAMHEEKKMNLPNNTILGYSKPHK